MIDDPSPATDPPPEAILCEFPDPGAGVGLADEMMEDPRCRLVLLGSDEHGAVLLTLWDREVVDEVERGLRSLVEGRVRRLRLLEGG